MDIWLIVALVATVWATVATVVALIVGRAARLRNRRDQIEHISAPRNDSDDSDRT